MDAIRIFVSHSSHDKPYCRKLVAYLRNYAVDVWYDEHNLGYGQLVDDIQNEISNREVFIIILSKESLQSAWVKAEAQWAFNLFVRTPGRTILPVTASPLSVTDFDGWLFLESFRRVEAPNFQPFSSNVALKKVADLLQLTPKRKKNDLRQADELDNLTLQYEHLMVEKDYQQALGVINNIIILDPSSSKTWLRKAEIHCQLSLSQSEIFKGHLLLYGKATGEYWQAISAFGVAHNLDDRISIPNIILKAAQRSATILINDRDYNSALALYQQLLTYDDSLDWMWSELAILQMDMRSYESSLISSSEAIKRNPNSVISWIYRGNALQELKRFGEAQQAYERALEIAPDNASALSNLKLLSYIRRKSNS